MIAGFVAGFRASRSSVYNPPLYENYYSASNIKTYWPILDEEVQCRARKDILLNVRPGGCQPSVVRSDLLAEQNVPVFCKIDALEVNPLIDIKKIRNIRFKGEYPKEVLNAGFHPLRAALRSRDKLLGSPFKLQCYSF